MPKCNLLYWGKNNIFMAWLNTHLLNELQFPSRICTSVKYWEGNILQLYPAVPLVWKTSLGKLFFLLSKFVCFPLSQFHLDSCEDIWVVTGFLLLLLQGSPVWTLILKELSICSCNAKKGITIIDSTRGNYRKTFHLEVFLQVWEHHGQ